MAAADAARLPAYLETAQPNIVRHYRKFGFCEATHTQRETWLTEALERELDASERALLHEASVLLSRIADT